MLKSLRIAASAALLLAGFFITNLAKATTVKDIYFSLDNGGSFSGALTFSNPSLTDLIGVSGTLTDYQFGTKGYTGTGSDPINTVLISGLALPAGEEYEVTDGNNGHPLRENTVTFFLDLSDLSDVTIVTGTVLGIPRTGADVALDAIDPRQQGQTNELDGTAAFSPEPSSFVLLGSGLLGLAGLVRRKMGRGK